MGNFRFGAWVGWLLMAPLSATAGEGWETVLTGEITIRSRDMSGTSVKEVWAEGILNAEVQDLQSTILDAEAYPRFMPYVKESRYLGPAAADGSRLVYARLSLPFVSERDYVVRVTVVKSVAEDGSGEFANRWVADPDRFPLRRDVVRLRFNQGQWVVTPLPDGRSKVTYRFAVDPGGWVPSFAADMGNKRGVTETMKAVEKEARERGIRRKQQASLAPGTGRGETPLMSR